MELVYGRSGLDVQFSSACLGGMWLLFAGENLGQRMASEEEDGDGHHERHLFPTIHYRMREKERERYPYLGTYHENPISSATATNSIANQY